MSGPWQRTHTSITHACTNTPHAHKCAHLLHHQPREEDVLVARLHQGPELPEGVGKPAGDLGDGAYRFLSGWVDRVRVGRVEVGWLLGFTHKYVHIDMYACAPTRRGVDGGQGGAEGGELRPELTDAAVGGLAALAHGIADHA